MLEKAINRILDLAEVQEFIFAGREYTSKGIFPVAEPSPPILEVNTLRGLVDYLRSGFDRKEIGVFSMQEQTASESLRVALHIVSPELVEVFTPVGGQWKERNTIIRASWNRQPFPFGQWLDQEQFVIKMQAMFLPSKSWQPVMDVAGRIVCEDKAELHDDGVTQAVTVSKGVRKESGIILPNPVTLRPVRTFTEVEQPESDFVFRIKAEPIVLSLHEADMGAWEMAAKENIKAYLETELSGVPIFM